MKRKILLSIWLLAMLFPLNWVWQESIFMQRNFTRLFNTEWVHIPAHIFLFAGLALLLWFVFKFPFDARSAVMLAAVVLLVGGLQEVLQLQAKGRGFGWPEVFDLSVDLNGAALGFVIAWGVSSWRRRGAGEGVRGG